MNKQMNWDSEVDVDQLISEYDKTFMPLPDIEFEPHLLISKVRKHYMEHMIKILSVNYETNQRLVNKNIYLPSAIWKCAKKLEMKAAQMCMVVQLYRKCIVTTINEVKTDTKKGRLYNKLYESLHIEPQNEKRTQTVVTGENCQCYCTDKKRRRKRSSSPTNTQKVDQSQNNNSLTQKVEELAVLFKETNKSINNVIQQRIPVIMNMETDPSPVMFQPDVVDADQTLPDPKAMNQQPMSPKLAQPESDDLMLQLEKLFQGDKDDDDLFTSTLIEDNNTKTFDGALNIAQDSSIGTKPNSTIESKIGTINSVNNTQGSIIKNHAAQIKSLDERLATLTGMLVHNELPALVQPLKERKVVQKKSKHTSKWQCEEYFLKKSLFELLYQIGDNNRQKLARIKEMYIQLFGEDSDDEEGIMSPDESPEFVASCKARIDSWVMTILAPYYARGRIQGKMLYKSVARHLIELIYKCKQYPSRHEVTSFVRDFLETRGKIRCEADFKEFRIDNVHVVPNYSLS